MRPLYTAVSLADTFSIRRQHYKQNLGEAVLPSCREFGLPMSLMIGCDGRLIQRSVLPATPLAGPTFAQWKICAAAFR